MNVPNTKTESNRIYMIVKVIWGAILGSQLLILAVSQVVAKNEAHEDPALETALTFVALVSFAAALFLPKLLARKAIGPQRRPGPQSALEPALLEKLFPAWVVRFALFEAVTVQGLVVSMIVGNPAKIFPFFAFGVAGLLFNFPSPDRYARLGE